MQEFPDWFRFLPFQSAAALGPATQGAFATGNVPLPLNLLTKIHVHWRVMLEKNAGEIVTKRDPICRRKINSLAAVESSAEPSMV